jgi:hypothetical protein
MSKLRAIKGSGQPGIQIKLLNAFRPHLHDIGRSSMSGRRFSTIAHAAANELKLMFDTSRGSRRQALRGVWESQLE